MTPTKSRPGPKLLRGNRMVQRSISLTPEAWALLDIEAVRRNISTNELIRRKLGV